MKPNPIWIDDIPCCDDECEAFQMSTWETGEALPFCKLLAEYIPEDGCTCDPAVALLRREILERCEAMDEDTERLTMLPYDWSGGLIFPDNNSGFWVGRWRPSFRFEPAIEQDAPYDIRSALQAAREAQDA
ncbi:MAG: hypothetical protein ACYS7Y_29550 [Planctomycetota bacterium]|jgi:hypothetical protein